MIEAGYRLYEGNTDLGALSNKTITVTNQSYGSHTYTVKGYYYNSGHPITTTYGNPSTTINIADLESSVKWNGGQSLTAVYTENGMVTFTLNGSATSKLRGVTFDCNAFRIMLGNTIISNFGAYGKSTTAECPPGTNTYTCVAYLSSSQYGIDIQTATGNPTVTINVPAPTLSWSSGSNLTYEASGQNLVMHINGNITLGGGYSGRTIYYILYYGSTVKSQDGTSKDITVTNGATLAEGQWSLYAYVNTSGMITYSAPLTVTVSWSDCIAYYNGSRWIQCIAYYYNGSRWVECKPYYYNGSRWVELAYKP